LSNKNINYVIDFVSKTTLLTKKVYDILRQKEEIIKVYLNNIKSKDQIRNSISQYATLIFIIKKLNKRLCVCVNYKALNVFTIKNRNISLLIKETLQRLCKTRFYNKFDIIAIFNEIRMSFNNEHKIIFIIRYNSFKYVVILFELCNALTTFQFFINETLSSYLNKFYIIYINNILIYSNIKEEHENYINKIFVKLDKTSLYLNINKCVFFVKQIKYLDLIIITKEI